MKLAARVAIAVALIPVFLGVGASLGYLGVLASGGSGWFILVGMAIGAFGLGAVAPHRWAVPLALGALVATYWVVAYADGSDSCNGRPNCEDNLGPWLSFWVPTAFFVMPAFVGALLQPRLRRGRSKASGPSPNATAGP